MFRNTKLILRLNLRADRKWLRRHFGGPLGRRFPQRPVFAMFRTSYRPVAWLLITTLLIVTGGGEALHFIPGYGHGVQFGDIVVVLGINTHQECDDQTADGQRHLKRPDGDGIPVYGGDQCAICSVVGQSCTSTEHTQFVLVMPLVHDLPAVVSSDTIAAAARLFQARAPPLV